MSCRDIDKQTEPSPNKGPGVDVTDVTDIVETPVFAVEMTSGISILRIL